MKHHVVAHHAVVVLVADEFGLLALLVSSPEELAAAEAHDAAVVTDVHVTKLGLILHINVFYKFFKINKNSSKMYEKCIKQISVQISI